MHKYTQNRVFWHFLSYTFIKSYNYSIQGYRTFAQFQILFFNSQIVTVYDNCVNQG